MHSHEKIGGAQVSPTFDSSAPSVSLTGGRSLTRGVYVSAESLLLLLSGPQPDATSIDPCALHMNGEMSPAGSEVEDRPLGLPARLRHKELQVEQDFHGLLER